MLTRRELLEVIGMSLLAKQAKAGAPLAQQPTTANPWVGQEDELSRAVTAMENGQPHRFEFGVDPVETQVGRITHYAFANMYPDIHIHSFSIEPDRKKSVEEYREVDTGYLINLDEFGDVFGGKIPNPVTDRRSHALIRTRNVFGDLERLTQLAELSAKPIDPIIQEASYFYIERPRRTVDRSTGLINYGLIESLADHWYMSIGSEHHTARDLEISYNPRFATGQDDRFSENTPLGRHILKRFDKGDFSDTSFSKYKREIDEIFAGGSTLLALGSQRFRFNGRNLQLHYQSWHSPTHEMHLEVNNGSYRAIYIGRVLSVP